MLFSDVEGHRPNGGIWWLGNENWLERWWNTPYSWIILNIIQFSIVYCSTVNILWIPVHLNVFPVSGIDFSSASLIKPESKTSILHCLDALNYSLLSVIAWTKCTGRIAFASSNTLPFNKEKALVPWETCGFIMRSHAAVLQRPIAHKMHKSRYIQSSRAYTHTHTHTHTP